MLETTNTTAPATATSPLMPTAPAAPEPVTRKLRDAVPPDRNGWWWGTGRRKSAVARVRIRLAKDQPSYMLEGSAPGERTVEQYFSEARDRNNCHAPLKVTNTVGKFEVKVKCHGGGYMGQAGSVLLGLSRALVAYDPTLEPALRDAGFLTRDARKVERKKYGQAGARRRFQFSKR